MKFSLQISGKKSRCCETRVQSGKLGKSPIIPIICPIIPIVCPITAFSLTQNRFLDIAVKG